MPEEKLTHGWGMPGLSRKFHYFMSGRSLCGKWAYTGPLDPHGQSKEPQPDDCRECFRKMMKQFPERAGTAHTPAATKSAPEGKTMNGEKKKPGPLVEDAGLAGGLDESGAPKIVPKDSEGKTAAVTTTDPREQGKKPGPAK